MVLTTIVTHLLAAQVGQEGKDSIYGQTSGSTLDGGAGDDTISVTGYSNNIIGGTEKDVIYVGGISAIITGGKDDFIEMRRNTPNFSYGDIRRKKMLT